MISPRAEWMTCGSKLRLSQPRRQTESQLPWESSHQLYYHHLHPRHHQHHLWHHVGSSDIGLLYVTEEIVQCSPSHHLHHHIYLPIVPIRCGKLVPGLLLPISLLLLAFSLLLGVRDHGDLVMVIVVLFVVMVVVLVMVIITVLLTECGVDCSVAGWWW